MYQDALDDNNKTKDGYEAKVIDLEERLLAERKENESLKERNDILYKLGDGYIKQVEGKQTKSMQDKNNKNNGQAQSVVNPDGSGIAEIVVISEDNDSASFSTQRMRGFKKSPRNTIEPARTDTNQTPRPVSDFSNDTIRHNDVRNDNNNDNDDRPSNKYCHYFVNKGVCKFEENTGRVCKFLHKVAPMCREGLSCSRSKCMFSHPKPNGNQVPFLRNLSNFPPLMNPWGMMPQWMQQSTGQNTVNPWIWNQRQENQ